MDAANRGTIIKIESGTYKEAVLVDKPGITIIGMSCFSRDKVIIENPGDEDNGINVTDEGDDFVLKNVTIQNFGENGVLLTSVDNFLLSNVVAINNGEYGLSLFFVKMESLNIALLLAMKIPVFM